MTVKATIRKPGGAAPPPPYIDIEAHVVDTGSAEALANELEAEGRDGTSTASPGAADTQPRSTATATSAVGRPVSRTLVAASGQMDSDGGMEGDWDSSDLKLPQLKIVNGSGELSKSFNQGSLLYGDEMLWNPPSLVGGAVNPTMLFVPVQVRKQYRENLTQEEVEDGNMPRTANSRDEAEQLTGPDSTQWINGVKPKWSPSARCVFLLRAYDGCENPGFCNPLDGADWALAVYYASGMAYNESAKLIHNAAKISLIENGKIMVHKKVWSWQVVKSSKGKFTVFVPQIRLTKEETKSELREFVGRILGKTVEGEE